LHHKNALRRRKVDIQTVADGLILETGLLFFRSFATWVCHKINTVCAVCGWKYFLSSRKFLIAETTVIGQMAAKVNWNLPMISYISADDSLSDKTIYSTLARTSVTTQTFYSQAVNFVLAQIGWKKVAYIGSQSTTSNLALPALKLALTPSGVSIYTMTINVNATWQSVAKNKAMVNLKANARGRRANCTFFWTQFTEIGSLLFVGLGSEG
jgi:hypothetical protein